MKNFIFKYIFTIAFLFVSSSIYPENFDQICQNKFYFNRENLDIEDNAIYIRLQNEWIKTNNIRLDDLGFYIYEDDIIERGSQWKCPYCYHWNRY